eukprot:10586499-Karenia_brevis.AAC.1
MHDDGFDPSSEMGYIFGDKPSASGEGVERDTEESVTMHGIAKLLQSELKPLKDSMSNMEGKFSQLQIHVEGEMKHMKDISEKAYQEHRARTDILESNIDTLYGQV